MNNFFWLTRTHIKKYQTVLIIGILLFAFITRIFRLDYPPKYMFDEVYHGITIKLISQNDPRAFEWWHPQFEPGVMIDWLHPPLAKYTQAIGVLLVGDTSFGWRISSAVFGVGVIWLIYLLGKKLFSSEVGLLAAFLASLDGLLLVQSRIAMNDIHVTFFTLLSLLSYLAYREKQTIRWLLVTSIILGLTIASKWSGAFVIGIVGLSECFYRLHDWWTLLQKNKKASNKTKAMFTTVAITKTAAIGAVLIAVPIVVYIASYGQMFMQGKGMDHFLGLHNQIWWYQTSLEATHPYQSRPWQWFLNLRPVWFYANYADDGSSSHIYAFGNPALHLVGVSTVLLSIGLLIKMMLTNQKSRKDVLLDTKWPQLLWILGVYLLLWTPWQFSPRIMFYYHYTPAVPILCIIMSYWLIRSKKTKLIVALVGFIFFSFILWYPRWTALTAPHQLESLYILIKSWK